MFNLYITETENTINIYPNPSEGLVKLSYINMPLKVIIIIINGQVLQSITPNSKEIQFQLSEKGMYLIQIYFKGFIETKKVITQ